jgi:hypothetical protein
VLSLPKLCTNLLFLLFKLCVQCTVTFFI